MGRKKKNSGRRAGNRFFRWMRSDLPDDEDKKSPVLLLGVNKITDSPFARRRSGDGATTTGSIRFFRPPKSKYTRGLHGDERLEKIRQDLLTHKQSERHIPNERQRSSYREEETRCIKLNCVQNCACRHNSSDRGSFSFRRSNVQVLNDVRDDSSEHDIEFKYTELNPENQPGSSKQTSYNVTPRSTERRSLLLANLNERFRKTLSLDSRKVETHRTPCEPQPPRPKSLINTNNIVQVCKPDEHVTIFCKSSQPKKKRKSFFSLEIFDWKSDTSSIDDYCSSKYKRFELESDDSPLFRREKTPDLLKLPAIIDSVRRKESDTKRQLEKLENHYYLSLSKSTPKTVIDAIPKDATNIEGPSGRVNHLYIEDSDVEYIEPIRSNFTSQSTLILDKNIPLESIPDSILTIDTDETDIKLPSSTVSPKSNDGIRDVDSLGPYEIEVKASDLKNRKNLRVKIMDKSVDSIGSCSLDVDASTDFSDTTSGSLNLLTPTSTTSRVRDFTAKIHERANLTPVITPLRTPDHTPTPTPTPKPIDKSHLLKPPPKVVVSDNGRGRHRKREEVKKPSYLNLACSVNGYSNLTTYDSKLRQDINKSREASPIRPITHCQYKFEGNSLVVPVPVSADTLLVPQLQPHDHLTGHLSSPYAYMAEENKQLKKDFLGPNMAATRPYVSSESKTFAASMLHQKTDEVDNATFKSSRSETNFRRTVVSNGQTERVTSEYTVHKTNGVSKRVDIAKENGELLTSPMKSFIQQRVERLYGPGALAQGFFNQKRHKTKSRSEDGGGVLAEKSLNCSAELRTPRKAVSMTDTENTSPTSDGSLSLPVLRHLRPEFRAQLPILSPKKSPRGGECSKTVDIPIKTDCAPVIAESEVTSVANGVADAANIVVASVPNGVPNGVAKTNGCDVKDGHYFLGLEKRETARLLALADSADKELESLQDKDVSEEVLGFLRAAAGKARLLATQKMQQFQGLCYNHINARPSEPFPTTAEDLQGFWDMVALQVRHVDALHHQLAAMRARGWTDLPPEPRAPAAPAARAAPPRPRRAPPHNEKAKAAADKREADRRAMLELKRRIAKERQLAASCGVAGASRDMSLEGSQEVEIFVGKAAKPSKVVPTGDFSSSVSEDSLREHS